MSDYEKMTVAELKDLLREAGLPVSGKKADLIARLQEGAEEAPVVEESEEEESEEEYDDEFEDEDWDDEEFDDEHVARQKPVLSDETKEALALRAAQKKATPSFPQNRMVPIQETFTIWLEKATWNG